jgi:hypothetical protein
MATFSKAPIIENGGFASQCDMMAWDLVYKNMLYFIRAKTRSIHEVIHLIVKAIDHCEDEIQMLVICPLALLA